MEDNDPQSTRKRPRLDSGPRERDHMPVPPSSGSSPGSRVDDFHESVAGCSPPPRTPDRSSPSSPAQPTPSSGRLAINVKSPVTPDANGKLDNLSNDNDDDNGISININDHDKHADSNDDHRDPNAITAPLDASAAGDADTSVTERGETPEQLPQSTEVSPQDVSAVSVASSPTASSLQIEVAEVEDMDQDPSTSSWRPLEDALKARAAPEPDTVQFQDAFSPAASFPRLRRNIGVREAVEDIRKILEKGHDYELTMFDAVRGWLHQCVERRDQITHETCIANQELWAAFPSVAGGLLRRDTDFQPDAGQGPWWSLESFFVSFVELALHMIGLDVEAMRSALDREDGPPEMVSKSYWAPIMWLLKFNLIPLYSTLEKIHGSEVASMIARINDTVAQPPINILPRISEFLSLFFDCVSVWPVVATFFPTALQVIHQLVDSAAERKKWLGNAHLIESPAPKNTVRLAYGVLRPIDIAYHALVSKKPQWITSDTTETVIRTIGSSYQIMATYDPEFGMEIAQGLGIEFPSQVAATPTERAQIISLGWRFRLLYKEVTDGRMECRVHGVEAMQRDLVELWHQNIRGNPEGVHGAVPQYLVKYIRDIEFVKYIVGIDSHPQLISRSGNIVGFLVVTFTYTNEDTDVIWHSVTESQDARFVGEVVGLLCRIVSLMGDTEPLLYICEKLTELPLERFDMHVVELLDQLLKHYMDKHYEKAQSLDRQETTSSSPYVDVVPVRLCVRLIREVRSAETLSVEQKTQIQMAAGRQLSQLIGRGIADSDKIELFQRCTTDLAEMNELAVGSVHALLSLTSPYDTSDITRLALDFDLTRLIVAELAKSIDTTSPGEAAAPGAQKAVLVPRIQLLLRVVEKVPDTISFESTQMLWDSLFMSKKVDDSTRSLAWDMLSQSLARSPRRNSFFEWFMNDFLGRIPPEELGPHILAFAQQAVAYELRFDQPPTSDEGEVISIPGMERIWDFILTAPPNTVEMKAINFAIDTYLDDNLIRNAPRSAAEATHVALVDRCVRQLNGAASKLKNSCEGTTSGEDEPMVIIPSDRELQLEELRFSRSLLFLRQLLHGLRTRPQYTPPQGSPPQLVLKGDDDEVKGDPIELSYQAFNDVSHTPIKKLCIGDLATASDLAKKLGQLTGFASFSTIMSGQRVNLADNASETLRDLKLARSGLLIIRNQPDADLDKVAASGRRQSLTLVDSEVLKHFDDLYELLALDDRLSKEVPYHTIFDFLVVFPPQQHVREFARSLQTTCAEMFPLDKPYKLLYSINCLATCLREEMLEPQPDENFINHSILNLAEFLTLPEMEISLEDSSLRVNFAHKAVDCLMVALTAKPTPEQPCQHFFPDPSVLTTRLLNLLSVGQKTTSLESSELSAQKLISNSLAVLIEASVHDSSVWDLLKENTRIEDSISGLLLTEPRQGVRKEVAEIISRLCGCSLHNKQAGTKADDDAKARLSNPTAIDIISTLWKTFLSLFAKTLDYPTSSQEFFEVALVVFQTVFDLSPSDLVLGDYIQDWGSMLLQHRTQEFVGRERVDYVVLGFAQLIKMCLDLAPSHSVADNTRSLVESLFTAYLFPHLSDTDGSKSIDPAPPVMHSTTRQELYNVLLLLCSNRPNCEKALQLLEDVIPQDYTYDPNWIFDRYKTIRSPEGYAGLRNLSNTCYLNSLFTQLFMNVDFRKFMLEVEVTDPSSTQKLLAETKKIFAYMQDTWQKSVDPTELVESIRTYENESIDINIQMDVDEFYNLLFDRWEGQISSAEDRKAFRSFYGGQLVQQIKSKECSHISERFEPFSAIQCDIKGRSNLEDSLRAYVEGETMQGDNKYSCTSCGRHVDAVKRACLKDLPDNLIFHLKRFDFDVISMMRSKINDEFHFPERIDMTPFKVEHLSDPATPVEPDIFELVGVLVHSGTAETGHYYSYIKERPSAEPAGSTWVEFNDSDVDRFEPGKIPDQCFGGLSESSFGTMRFNKVWNAYMLFYQRVSHMETTRSVYQPPSSSSKDIVPVTVPVPLDLGNYIAMDNEMFVRAFCLLDPHHAFFVRGIFEQAKRVAAAEEDAKTSGDIQKLAVWMALDNLDQIISRTKDLPEADKLFVDLTKTMENNLDAAFWVLDWTAKRPAGIRNLLVKCPAETVRDGFGQLLLTAIVCLKGRLSADSLTPDEAALYHEEYTSMLSNVVVGLQCAWPFLQYISRSWDNFFGTLLSMARLGPFELEHLLDGRFLLKCLEIIWVDREDAKGVLYQYQTYWRLVEKGRKFSHFMLMELLYTFLADIDLSLEPRADGVGRECRNGKFSLTVPESDLIMSLGQSKELSFLKKIVEQQSSNSVAWRKIISLLVNTEGTTGLAEAICRALEEGLRVDPASMATPFLEATLLFCQVSTDPVNITHMVEYTAKGVESINDSGGEEHLTFFQSLATSHNDRFPHDEFWFWSLVVERIPDWAPTLLHYPDKTVRTSTLDFLRQLLFSKGLEDMSEEFRQFYRRVGRALGQACVERLLRAYFVSPSGPVRLDQRVVVQISQVITYTIENYYDNSGSDEDDARFVQRASSVVRDLNQLTVELSEELVSGSELPSEWEDNSAVASDSDIGLPGSP